MNHRSNKRGFQGYTDRTEHKKSSKVLHSKQKRIPRILKPNEAKPVPKNLKIKTKRFQKKTNTESANFQLFSKKNQNSNSNKKLKRQTKQKRGKI